VVDRSTDEALIERIHSGDAMAEHELYRGHHGYALRVAIARGAQLSDAEDFVQEAFIRILGYLRRGNRPTGSFRPYLSAAVRNAAADAHRRGSSREYPCPDAGVLLAASTQSAPHDEVEARAVLHGALRDLPVSTREMLWLLDVEGYSIAYVADASGVSAPTLAARASRARRAARRAIARAD